MKAITTAPSSVLLLNSEIVLSSSGSSWGILRILLMAEGCGGPSSAMMGGATGSFTSTSFAYISIFEANIVDSSSISWYNRASFLYY